MNPNRPPLLLLPPGQRSGKDRQLRIDQYLPNPKRFRKADSAYPQTLKQPSDEAAAPPATSQSATEAAYHASSGLVTMSAPYANTTSTLSQISNLSLEAYMQLYSALTKGMGLVQQVSNRCFFMASSRQRWSLKLLQT